MRCLLPSLLFAVQATRAASAQTTAQGIRDLDFGVVIQGVAKSVAPSDPINSGQFYFRTPGIGSRVRFQFTLPAQLNGPAGATMPISFAATDAIARGTAPSSVSVTFDPRTLASFTMTTSADANIWLGARVTPAAAQRVGSYTNTVTLTITIF